MNPNQINISYQNILFDFSSDIISINHDKHVFKSSFANFKTYLINNPFKDFTQIHSLLSKQKYSNYSIDKNFMILTWTVEILDINLIFKIPLDKFKLNIDKLDEKEQLKYYKNKYLRLKNKHKLFLDKHRCFSTIFNFIKKDDIIYVVRISPKNKISVKHFLEVQSNLVANKTITWDNNYLNNINIDDFYGFLIGPTHDITIILFKILDIKNISNRKNIWNKQDSYNDNNHTIHDIKTRNVIFLSNHFITVSWTLWKKIVEYKVNYTPMNVTKIKNPLNF